MSEKREKLKKVVKFKSEAEKNKEQISKQEGTGVSYAPDSISFEDAWIESKNKGEKSFVWEGKQYDVNAGWNYMRIFSTYKDGKWTKTNPTEKELEKARRSVQTYHEGYKEGGYNEPKLDEMEHYREYRATAKGEYDKAIPGFRDMTDEQKKVAIIKFRKKRSSGEVVYGIEPEDTQWKEWFDHPRRRTRMNE